MPGKRVTVGGVVFDAFTEDRVVAHVRESLDRGIGGRILTPNVDIVRQVRRDPFAAGVVASSSIVVADGMPLIWAARLAGTPLPARVCGSDLIWSLSRGMGLDGRSIFILGGEPAPVAEPGGSRRNAGPAHAADPVRRRDGRDGAGRAAARLSDHCPGLAVAGAVSPPYGFDRDPAVLDALVDRVVAARPDLVLVGIGFPRQERLIDTLRTALPRSWFLGCGMAIGFVAGEQRRAPEWMRRSGVEWLHRLASEPGRLAERYLRHDLPFAVSLLGNAAMARFRPPAAPAPAARPHRNEVTGALRPRPRSGLNERPGPPVRPPVPVAVDPWPDAVEPRRSDGFTGWWEMETRAPAGEVPGETAGGGRRHRKTRRHGR